MGHTKLSVAYFSPVEHLGAASDGGFQVSNYRALKSAYVSDGLINQAQCTRDAGFAIP
jgi:hypothetical protein